MKKVKKVLMGILMAALLTLPTSAFASVTPMGAGEWDTLLDRSYYLSPSSITTTELLYSGGGDVRFCVSGVNSDNIVSIALYDYDPDDVFFVAALDVAGPQSGETCTGKIDARPFVDGDKAEFYLTISSKTYDTVRVRFQD